MASHIWRVTSLPPSSNPRRRCSTKLKDLPAVTAFQIVNPNTSKELSMDSSPIYADPSKNQNPSSSLLSSNWMRQNILSQWNGNIVRLYSGSMVHLLSSWVCLGFGESELCEILTSVSNENTEVLRWRRLFFNSYNLAAFINHFMHDTFNPKCSMQNTMNSFGCFVLFLLLLYLISPFSAYWVFTFSVVFLLRLFICLFTYFSALLSTVPYFHQQIHFWSASLIIVLFCRCWM